MFQFRAFPTQHYGFMLRWRRFSPPGFPIRTSADRRLFAPPRSFSQLITSFIGSWCQGILPTLFLAWSLEVILLLEKLLNLATLLSLPNEIFIRVCNFRYGKNLDSLFAQLLFILGSILFNKIDIWPFLDLLYAVFKVLCRTLTGFCFRSIENRTV